MEDNEYRKKIYEHTQRLIESNREKIAQVNTGTDDVCKAGIDEMKNQKRRSDLDIEKLKAIGKYEALLNSTKDKKRLELINRERKEALEKLDEEIVDCDKEKLQVLVNAKLVKQKLDTLLREYDCNMAEISLNTNFLNN